MKIERAFAAGFLAVFMLTSAVLILDQEEDSGELEINSSGEEVKRTEDGTKYTVHPDRLRRGCPSIDCIPSIDDPEFQEASEADWLRPGDRVIGLEINGSSRAYPLRILRRHEIVNDRIDGEPVAVTYCPLCRSGLTYSREVGNETLEFGVSGKLLDANLVMYDRSTETYWSQIQGEAIIGPRTPQELDLIFSSITTWRDWRSAHPDTRVLSRRTGAGVASDYEANPYSGYANSSVVGFGVSETDGRLPSKELVHGIVAGGQAVAYPDSSLEPGKLVQDRVGGEPVAVFRQPDDGTVRSLVRRHEGKTLNLELVEGGLEDSSGRLWSFEGEMRNGTGSLETLTPRGFYWFAWSKFHPETEIYRGAR